MTGQQGGQQKRRGETQELIVYCTQQQLFARYHAQHLHGESLLTG